ncbi:hypothetical protein [Streptomyces collinus]|uniref:hypothetical protein n=1 Tax=Streptomyces collinus TaxID=42684 RepID=UPI0033F50688
MATELVDFDWKPFQVGATVYFAIDGKIMEGEVKLADHNGQVVIEGLGRFYLIAGEYRKRDHSSAYWFQAVARKPLELGPITLPPGFKFPLGGS